MKKATIQTRLRRLAFGAGAMLATGILVLGVSGNAVVAAAAANQTNRMTLFNSAAKEFGVPVQVLVALAYNESRLVPHGSAPSVDGGFGLTNLTTKVTSTVDGRGDGKTKQSTNALTHYTLDEAASLLHVTPDTLKTSDQQNIRGAAAVLAGYAKQNNNGTLPTSINDWYAALAEFSGSSVSGTASGFADDVFATIQKGLSLTTQDGQAFSVPAIGNIQANRAPLAHLGLNADATNTFGVPGQNPECPITLSCRFIPAAYAQDDPNDPTNYGNYDPAHRPADMQIKYIYIHDTEGSYDSAISHFQDPHSYVSANYVIRSSDGAITQMVPNSDVSWGIGDWYMNMHGINIEHEGKAAQGATWYTEAMYKSSATLVRYLAAKYHIPLDRQHILGHDNVPTLTQARMSGQHWDPGPFWDWNHYMDLVHGQSDSSTSSANARKPKVGMTITISPNFATNKQTITDCQQPGPCVTLPPQGSDIVYLHTQPMFNSTLISNPYLHGGTPGTTEDADMAATASTGEQFVVGGIQGDWTGVWYSGQLAWFYNPGGSQSKPSYSVTVKPKAGMSSIAVYGAAYPEASAYPATIPVQTFDQLYSIPAGQSYTTDGEIPPTDYFYDWTINYSAPDDHMVVHGNQKYYKISFNHRVGFVKADDVVLSR
ncbi:MAG TPA: peptidoglycan recognition family protein [Candidatus Saccharimonadales bacterium]|nr:peptidoglycan recognition family protein [Candidatus Saccharimonadales bacterium]